MTASKIVKHALQTSNTVASVLRKSRALAKPSETGYATPADVENPLASVEYTGNPETDTVAEASAILTSFRQRGKDEKATYRAATDSEFWFAICFRTREQKDAFLAATGWNLFGDKYLDGHDLALMMDIELPEDARFLKRKTRIDKRLIALTDED